MNIVQPPITLLSSELIARFRAIVGDKYARILDDAPIPDDVATKLTNDYLQVEQDEVNLKKAYAKKLTGVIPAAKIARYLQIETKIRSAIKFDMSKNIPLVK